MKEECKGHGRGEMVCMYVGGYLPQAAFFSHF